MLMKDAESGRSWDQSFCWGFRGRKDPFPSHTCSPEVWARDPASLGAGKKVSMRKRSCQRSHRAEQETVGPTVLPAEKDTDNSANTFNALRIHGRKKIV